MALFGDEDVTKQARKFQKEGVKTFQACSNFWKVKSTGKQALSIVFKTRILFFPFKEKFAYLISLTFMSNDIRSQQ